MHKKLKRVVKTLIEAKPGDTIEPIKGIPVEVRTVEECEEADVHICATTAELKVCIFPCIKGHCSRCGTEIWIGVNSPAKPKKVCMPCALKDIDEETTTA